ncbi:MAG: hypothetical protein WC881_08385, partial [Elusimicrobiota bacterium]
MSHAEKLLAVLIACLCVPVFAHAKACPKDTRNLPRRIVSCQPDASLAQCRAVVEEVSCSVVRELTSIHALVITVPSFG